jgi:asparagine synthase (glutamine-hydrolysing)
MGKKINAQVKTDYKESLEELKELMHSSIQYRLISDVPYGAFLSGGIDSSLVSAIAQKESNHQLKTFSIGFENAKHNESDYAEAVAKHLGTDHYKFILGEREALGLVDSIWDYYDEPYADSSAIPTMLVSKMAKQQVTMTVSGDGGDELFLGYGMYNWARRLEKPLIKQLRKPIAAGLNLGTNRYQRIAKMFDYGNKDCLQSHIFSQEQYFFSSQEILRMTQMNCENIFLQKPLERKLTPEEQQAFFDLKYYLPDDLLVKVDRASMKYALETRVPILDHRIVEFALNLAPDLKVKNGVQKYLLKELLYQYVPKELFDRPKWGFSIPLHQWLKSDLKYLCDRFLDNKLVQSCGLVDYKEVELLKKAYYKHGKEYLYNRIWALIQLHRWFVEKF